MYSEYSPEIFKQQTAWIASHRDDLNIKFVIGLGDNVNDGDSDTQWKNASDAMAVLDQAGVPYAMAIGNHDYLHSKPPTRSAPLFNKYFGKSRYDGKSWYGDSTYPAGTSENFYVTLPIEGEKYLLLFLEYFPRHEAIAWAKAILDRHSDSKVIVITHALEGSDAFRNGRCDYNGPSAEGLETNFVDGDQMWSELISQNPNIFLALNGHVNGAAHETDFGKHGNAVTQILADYQDDAEGGAGFLRILTFSPAQHKIVISTYSPYSQSYKTDEQNSFTVPYDNAGLDTNLAGIRGRVRNNECESVAGASVTFSKTVNGPRVFTDSDGYFVGKLPAPEPGVYRVTANAVGYSTASSMVEVRTGFTTPIRFYLAKTDKEFTLAAPASATLDAGSAVTIPVTAKRIGGFSSPIRLTTTVFNDGLNATLGASLVTSSKAAQLKIAASPQLPPGKYKIEVTGRAGQMVRTVSLEVSVSGTTPAQ